MSKIQLGLDLITNTIKANVRFTKAVVKQEYFYNSFEDLIEHNSLVNGTNIFVVVNENSQSQFRDPYENMTKTFTNSYTVYVSKKFTTKPGGLNSELLEDMETIQAIFNGGDGYVEPFTFRRLDKSSFYSELEITLYTHYLQEPTEE